ncbi:MAG: hypothetical protein AAFQ89_18085 [Cyanobacteria bacterium J06626_18]
MQQPWQKLRSWLLDLRRLRFWVSLLILGFGFWMVGKLITLRILHRTYENSRYFIANVQPREIANQKISSIKVQIYSQSNLSIVEVNSDDPTLLEREFQFRLNAPQAIERAIAQELGLPLEEVRSLVYYKVRNQ